MTRWLLSSLLTLDKRNPSVIVNGNRAVKLFVGTAGDMVHSGVYI